MRALILLCVLIATPAFAADWVDLIDSKTLQGWRQHNGTTTSRGGGGAIVGETAEASPNSFLCTTRDYGDFEMEFDVEVHDRRLNTGIHPRATVALQRRIVPRIGTDPWARASLIETLRALREMEATIPQDSRFAALEGRTAR